ncbi:MAG: two-component system, OmpR family, sensor histidine kinase SenX3, partial [Actinomycetota bacterium]|nr:two-component system, OmpR family, sensor histidine kinase SenX3 [Actinomycetota bacterium]
MAIVLIALALALTVTVAVFYAASQRRTMRALETRAARAGRDSEAAAMAILATNQRWEDVVGSLSEGVVILSRAATPSYANDSARRMLGFDSETLPPRLPSEQLASMARRTSSGPPPVEELVELRTPTRRTLIVRARAIAGTDDALLTMSDVSEEAKTQTMRRQFVSHASHELKSPVASIHALAEALGTAIESDPARAKGFADNLAAESER